MEREKCLWIEVKEDRLNRLKDSFLLQASVCSLECKLAKKTGVVQKKDLRSPGSPVLTRGLAQEVIIFVLSLLLKEVREAESLTLNEEV